MQVIMMALNYSIYVGNENWNGKKWYRENQTALAKRMNFRGCVYVLRLIYRHDQFVETNECEKRADWYGRGTGKGQYL